MATLDLTHPPIAPRPSLASLRPSRPGAILAIWAAMTIGLHAALWATGFEARALRDAVDLGAARAETAGAGEVADDLVRKAIRLQRGTIAFWTTLARLGDFVVEPAALAVRAVAAATLFAAIAALTGRPIGFEAGLLATSRAQGFWVLALAVKVGLMIAIRRVDVETSAALLLPAGRYPAAIVLLARQADPLVVWGWLAMAWGGYRRRQVNLAMGLVVCSSLAFFETSARIACALVMGAGMRLTILP